ncbi:CDP-alcohol phosphatidyltransferase-domain-containing protein [Lophiotrema nucula]|uniref:CDP-alcohol phosphatidyltransferase-domain-containing protein n=1 Tax=Lophiotrema nucula TaxID=690887 RepID=A0A6A5Z7J3_9PLEO|nr:CDP-alcohol phosphatidyltransferase-domain-containing protein [Lophiotrema nucula]
MARPILPSSAIRFALSPQHIRSGLSQLSGARQSLLQVSSRASYSWPATKSQPYFSQHRKAINCSRTRQWTRTTFSTSTRRKAEREDAEKSLQEGASRNNAKDSPPKPRPTPSTRLTTLAAKVKFPGTLRHENIYTLPNILTVSRLIATPVIGYLIIHNHHLYAFSLFAYAGFSDLLDGWIARRWNLQTVVGSVIDPLADKALMTTLVTCLAVNGSLPLPLATLILGRDVSLAVAAIYYRYASLPGPKTWRRYWDFSLPSAEVHPTTMSKFNTFLQLVLIGTTLCVNLLHDPSAMHSAAGEYLNDVREYLGGEDGVKSMVQGLQVVVAGTTIWSGLSYAWLKSAVKILGEDEVLKRKQGFRGRMIVGGCFGSVVLLAIAVAVNDFVKSEEDAMDESHD